MTKIKQIKDTVLNEINCRIRDYLARKTRREILCDGMKLGWRVVRVLRWLFGDFSDF